MRLFRLFGRGKEIEASLWDDGVSIYQHISDNIDPQSGRLKQSAHALPDDARRFKPGELRWVSGAMDGIFSHHVAHQDLKQADQIADLLCDLSRTGSPRSKEKLYEILLQDSLTNCIDPAMEKAVDMGLSPEPYLHDFARLLAMRSPDRGPVKFGIAILGLIRDPTDLEVIKTLGKHDEFTLFSAVAVSNTAANPDAELFELAKVVDGWGKIHLVERLAQTEDPAIRHWLIRDGYKNSIMYGYLAFMCAVGGGLHQELANPSIDEELFDGAGDIIEALISGGPAESIHEYEHAADVIGAYLEHFGSFPKKIKHFLVLRSIDRYLSGGSWDDTATARGGWSEESRNQAMELVRRYSAESAWTELVQRGLSSSDQQVFYNADRAAQHLGIDTWSIHWRRLQSDPTTPSNWFSLMSLANEDRIDEIVGAAVRMLPLDEVATGPAEEMDFGPAYEIHRCLDFVVQGLDRYPGKGEALILAALASPVTRNRNMALKALSTWSADERSDELDCALNGALSVEPVDDLRTRILKVLRGEGFE
jgi:hypothetical protein